MQSRQRRGSALALLVSLSLLMVACGSTASPPPAATAGSPEQASGAPSAAAATPAVTADSSILTIFSDWTGGDQAGFSQLVGAFAQETGIQVELTGTTDFLPVLQTRIASGNVPMIAIVPRPGVIADLAGQSLLQPLDQLGVDLAGNYSQGMIDLGAVDGTPYGLIVKANSKSVIYHRPEAVEGGSAPGSWDDLMALLVAQSADGNGALVVTAKDGWTLTDWFENVYIRTAGPDRYQDLFTGKLPFTDPSVASAIDTMLALIRNEGIVAGGLDVAQSTGYIDGLARVFGANADGKFIMEGGFTTNVIPDSVDPALQAGEDFQLFSIPAIDEQHGSPVVLGGDFAVAFADNDATRQFMAFLARPETATLWANVGVISPNKNADTSALPNVLMSQESDQLTSAESARFDGSDQLPGGVGNDWSSTLQGIYAAPDQVQTLLETFTSEAAAAGFGG
jgi:alpha-glucoside transport system substrate-binding protein